MYPLPVKEKDPGIPLMPLLLPSKHLRKSGNLHLNLVSESHQLLFPKRKSVGFL